MKRPMWMCAADGAETGASTDAPPPEGGFAAAFDKAMAASDGAPEPKPDPAPEPAPKPEPEPKPEKAKKETVLKSLDGIPDGIFGEPAKKDEPAKDAPKDEFNSEELSKNLSTKGRENWKRMESHYQQKLEALQRERDEAKVAAQNATKSEEVAAIAKERDAMKSQLDEMSGLIERISLQHSPRFQQQFVQAREKLVNEAAKRVETAGGDKQKFLEALALSGRDRYQRLEEAIVDAPAFITNQVSALVTQIEALDEQRAEAVRNASTSLQQWGEEQQAQQREQATKLIEAKQREFQSIMEKVPNEVLFMRRIEGNDDWNAKVDKMHADAQELLFNSNDYPSFVKAAAKAAAYDQVQAAFLALREKWQAAEQELSELRAAEPGTGTGGGSGSVKRDDDEKDLTFAERYQREMAAA